jgi:bacteriorhodopsin|eukprot:CAMPEP_0180053364 /NCGR_PEP_ID=MMETSP0985-20121206/2232_1 /TAXON_ID=483367 /ORGANISM="non described non described, Strain CCMP 2436" /LENGTH=232 /DNA_ID=CAMNT_0021982841 /DNA_START=75 /DNA_END=773 /DNA_ORIENTATION=+
MSLLIGFIIMFASTGAYYAMSLKYPMEKRTFHYVTMFVTGIASIAYLIMAFDGGNVMVTLASGDERKFFYVRYLDWAFTTPLLLLDIGLLAGASLSHISFIIGCDVLMIVGGLAGPVFFPANETAKWTLFTIGMIWFAPIIYAMLVEWKVKMNPAVAGTYSLVANLTVVLWAAYPIMWALCEGTGVLSDETEVILYTILDVTAKAALGFVLLGNHGTIEAATSGDKAGLPMN